MNSGHKRERSDGDGDDYENEGSKRSKKGMGGNAVNKKTKMCRMINGPQGCKFGSRCKFAHSVMEQNPGVEDPGFGRRSLQFGASASAKISMDAGFAEAVFVRNPANSKKISSETGVKLFIRGHETDPGQRNIVLEGTFDQMIEAGLLLRQLVSDLSSSTSHGQHPGSSSSQGATLTPGHYKTRMCYMFRRGFCSYGDGCNYAHSLRELR